MHLKILPILVLFVSALAMAGEEKNTKSELAARLARLLDYGTQWQNFEAECKQTVGTVFDPNAMYQSSPGDFGGITPRSSYWPRIQNIYRNYQLNICDAMKPLSIDSFFAKELANELTEGELRASIHFYSSPAGRRLGQATARAAEVGRNYLKQSIGSYDSPNYISTKKALEEVMQEFKKHPH